MHITVQFYYFKFQLVSEGPLSLQKGCALEFNILFCRQCKMPYFVQRFFLHFSAR